MLRFLKIIFFIAFTLLNFSLSWSQSIVLKTKGIQANDKNDDSDAINKLIYNQKGDSLIIIFDKGEYILNTPLRIEKPVQLILSKETVLKVNNDVGGILVFASHFSISGGKIICRNTNQPDYNKGFGILMQGVEYCSISNITIIDFMTTGIIMIPNGKKGCSYNKISNNKLESTDISGLAFIDKSAIMLGYSGYGYSHDNNIIENNTVEGNYAIHHGIALIGHGKNNLVKSNNISHCASYGIVLYEILSDSVDFTMVDNQIIDNQISFIGNKKAGESDKGMGIYLMKTSGTLVMSNTISNVLDNNGPDESLPPGGIALNTSLNCIIQENKISQSNKYGLAAVYAKNLVIINNHISTTGYQPIYIIYSNDVSIVKNNLSSIGKETVKLKFGNTIDVGLSKDSFKDGFYNLETGKNIFLDDNTINVQNAKNIVYLDCPANKRVFLKLSIINNKLTMEGSDILPKGTNKDNITFKNNVIAADR
jgi:parallel beta-helix repeat protein